MYELINRNHNNRVNAYNPFRAMGDLDRDFFGVPFDPFFTTEDLAEFKTDITDQGDSFLLEADMPGFKKDDIHIDLDGDTLTVSAERHSEVDKSDESKKIIHKERSYGSYKRQFDISSVEADKISVKYDDGVLKLTMPKKTKQSPSARRIEIE